MVELAEQIYLFRIALLRVVLNPIGIVRGD